MATYNEQMQALANRYMLETGRTEATAKEFAAWAINNNLWAPQRGALIKQCADEFSRALREEYTTDPQGRRVRLKHMAVMDRGGEQTPLWADMRTATHEHMEVAFQQRRKGIVGDCKQLKNDVDSFNENFNSGEAIQIVFDFRDDLEEADALEEIS
ncbi:MAG: hypothetical protein WBY44_21215 [Bryobacteraceae bacterium]